MSTEQWALSLPERQHQLSFASFINLPPDMALELLWDYTAPRRVAIDQGLRWENIYGIFNEHGDKHHGFNLATTLELLERAHASDQEKNCAIAAVLLHDDRNRDGRKDHSKKALSSFAEVFRDFSYKDPRVRNILQAIYFHDETVGKQVPEFDSLKHNKPLLALIIADKADIHARRQSSILRDGFPHYQGQQITKKTVLNGVPHHTAILYAQENELRFSADAKRATVHISYSDQLDPEDYEAQPAMSLFAVAPGSPHLDHPDSWKREHRHSGKPYHEIYADHVVNLYHERLAMMTACLFTLFPDLEVSTFAVSDKHRSLPDYRIDLVKGQWQKSLRERWEERAGSISTVVGTTPPIFLNGSTPPDQRRVIFDDFKRDYRRLQG